MPLLEHGQPGIVSLRRILGLLVFQVIESLELHDRPGQLLGQPVVDFVGDELPFVVAGVQQVLEVAVFLRQCLLGLLAIRDVSVRNLRVGTLALVRLARQWRGPRSNGRIRPCDAERNSLVPVDDVPASKSSRYLRTDSRSSG